MEHEDKEEVGPTPSPGCPDGRVPVWPESNRTGEGRKFKPDSEQLLPPLSNSQVRVVLLNPLPANDALWCHETFSFMMSHPAMSLGDRLCASRKGWAGGGGWVHPKGANSMAESGLSFEQPLVGAG